MSKVKFRNVTLNKSGDVIDGSLTNSSIYLCYFKDICEYYSLTDDEFKYLSLAVGLIEKVIYDFEEAKVKEVRQAKKFANALRLAVELGVSSKYLLLTVDELSREDVKETAWLFNRDKTWENWKKVRVYL